MAAFGRFCAYCLLAALPVFVLRQDLLGAGNTLGERSLVELTARIDALTLDDVNAYLARRELGALTVVTLGPRALELRER